MWMFVSPSFACSESEGTLSGATKQYGSQPRSRWSRCDRVTMNQVTARGDYFAMNSRNMVIDGFELTGNYSFDGVKQAEIHNARLLSKDAFWNSENVTVYDSFISGEYLGWNAKNLTLINCPISSATLFAVRLSLILSTFYSLLSSINEI